MLSATMLTGPESTIEDWWRSGSRLALRLPNDRARARHVFYRCHANSSGPWLTLLHGFPTCSWDWAPLWPTLAVRFRLLTCDYLGYGDSDKPRDLAYSTPLHADTLEALWRALGITRTFLVGHDIGTAVAQELLARRADGDSDTSIAGTLLMNGAIITDRYQPRPIQRLLTHPLTGPLLARAMNERAFLRSLARAFGPGRAPDAAVARQYWQAMQRRDGHRLLHRLMHYIPERAQHKARWETSLTTCRAPLRFVWGMADPFTGAYIAEDVRRRVPSAYVVELAGVGHFPMLEAPAEVAQEILAFAAAG
jgi:pimeloyl-ACP methyl ester carboxylesterase